jgi:hypothetical protein
LPVRPIPYACRRLDTINALVIAIRPSRGPL